MSAAGDPSGWDEAHIHLQVLGQDRAFTVPVPLGERTFVELLPAAGAITEQAAAIGAEQAASAGRRVSCRDRCSACCRHLVAVSPVEALDIADHVGSLPAEERRRVEARFDDGLRRLETAGLLDPAAPKGRRSLNAPQQATRREAIHALSRTYFEQQIACPFLTDDSCGIYERRPMVCREHLVTSPPENCARLDGTGVESLTPPIDMAAVLARAAARIAGTPPRTVPLLLALEWAEAHGGALRGTGDGVELLRTLVGELDDQFDRGFDERQV